MAGPAVHEVAAPGHEVARHVVEEDHPVARTIEPPHGDRFDPETSNEGRDLGRPSVEAGSLGLEKRVHAALELREPLHDLPRAGDEGGVRLSVASDVERDHLPADG